jgi:hypothetical protein
MKPPAPTPPPEGAWSKTRDLGPFHPDSHFCGHCRGEIPPGGKLWFKQVLVLCTSCVAIFFPEYRN